MSSDNPSGAVNQQETAESLELDAQWVVGFVDGEGCFNVSLHRNPFIRSTGHWQIQAVFHVYQHQAHRAVLEALIPFFGCGVIRAKGPKSSVLTYAVSKRADLERRIVPFFEQHQLVVKGPDFRAFAEVVRALGRKEHLTPAGFERLVRLAYGMNAQGKQRTRTLEEVLAGSSETVRQAPSLFDGR
jgi:hypothetical protein